MHWFIGVILVLSALRFAMDLSRVIYPEDIMERAFGGIAVAVNFGIFVWGIILLWSMK